MKIQPFFGDEKGTKYFLVEPVPLNYKIKCTNALPFENKIN